LPAPRLPDNTVTGIRSLMCVVSWTRFLQLPGAGHVRSGLEPSGADTLIRGPY
jgi:hypothetical protein